MPRDAVDIVSDTLVGEKTDGVAYYCLRCGQLVTHADHAIRMNETHEHVVFNPAGLVFRIVCFRHAPGVVPVGNSSGEFSWFRGYDWRIALCTGCGIHLGWMYEGTEPPPVFFGLIRTLLVER